MAAVEAVLATRRTIDVARIEVPARSISTVLAKVDADRSECPESTQALRDEADRAGVAVAPVDARRGILVWALAKQRPDAPRGYLTVPVYLQGLQLDLANLAEARGLDAAGQANVVILDANRRVVAAVGTWNVTAGSDGSGLPFYRVLPEGRALARVEVQQEQVEGGVPTSITVVSAGRPDGETSLGWVIGLARPRAAVYAELERTRRVLLGVGALALLGGIVAAFVAARAVTRPVLALVDQAAKIGRRRYAEVSGAGARRDEVGDLGRAMVTMARDLEAQEQAIERELRRRADLSRFLAPEVVDAIVRGEHSLELGGHRAEITVLFADVVAFTPLAERHPPELAVEILNELFGLLSEVVFRHGGLVDKFVGDSLMALWGAPVACPDHASRAVRAAEDMLQFLEPAAEVWRERHGVEIRLAIGINTGSAIVGNIGSDKRMEYTAIGDTVNVAARLEAIARPNQILIAEGTAERVEGEFPLRRLGAQSLAGRATETIVFELDVS